MEPWGGGRFKNFVIKSHLSSTDIAFFKKKKEEGEEEEEEEEERHTYKSHGSQAPSYPT